MTDIDLTAAIEATRAKLSSEGADFEGGWHSWRCFDKLRYPEACTCTYDVSVDAVEAALPHIREVLAQQIEAQADLIARTQLEALGGLLTPLTNGTVAGHHQSARIVRGQA